MKHAPHLQNYLESFQEDLQSDGTQFRGVSTEIVICGDCEGRGVMTLRPFAFTADDFAEDPDFADDYRDGFYDEPCDTCDGLGRYYALKGTQQHPEVIEGFSRWLNMVAEDEAISRAESGYMY